MSRRAAWWLPVLAKIWPVTWKSAKATKWPLIGPVIARLSIPFFSKENLNVSYIPINAQVDRPDSSPLPQTIVEELIRRSGHRVIIGTCTCRDAKRCTNHPIDFGCIQLGLGTKQIDPRIARHVSVEECLDYLHQAVADGLIPMVGRVKIDDLLWGVKNEGRMLAVCLCCRCCCTIMNSGKYWPQEAANSLVRLQGLEVVVDQDRCTGCGACITDCFMAAIELKDSVARHDPSRCKGCGRCAAVCPHGAVSIRVSDMDAAVNDIMGRIDSLIDYR